MKRPGSWMKTACACLLAGALPAVAGAAPGINIYGVISSGLRYTSNIDGRHKDQVEVVSSGIGGSRWGISGSEDLGGGDKAVFLLENGFDTDTGKTTYDALFGRQAYVGLAGAWGSLTFGRQYHAVNNIGWAFNPLDESWGNYWSDPLYTGGDIFFQDYRVNNSIVYKHKKGPVSVQLDLGLGEQPGSARRGATFGGGLMFEQDGLAFGVAYDERRAATEGGNTLKNYSVGASYAVGKATAYLGHMGRRESAGDARFGISFAGLGYRLTPAWHLSGAYYRYAQRGGVRTQFQAALLSLGSGNADVFAAVADYALSKRTSAFLEADATIARGGAVGRETEYWGGAPVTDVDKSTRIGVMLGLRHQF